MTLPPTWTVFLFLQIKPTEAPTVCSPAAKEAMATGQGSNACSVLNSYHAGCQYELVEEMGPPHDKQFVIKVEILGVAYTGKGKSKKRAKQAAAASALRSIYNINLSLGMESPTEFAPPSLVSPRATTPPAPPAAATGSNGAVKRRADDWAATGATGTCAGCADKFCLTKCIFDTLGNSLAHAL